MKMLFLDIDGVLNSSRTYTAFKGYPLTLTENDKIKFDWVAIGLIRKLCEQTNTKIVLSSTWREHFPYQEVGEYLNLPIVDATPNYKRGLYGYSNRGEEIAAWLSEHSDVSLYAIVDDIDQFSSNQMNNFVKTDGQEGLTYNNYCQLYSILKDKEEQYGNY